ncbi:MAG: IS200/IS605 family transposase [Saprospiraceae bacterium]|nr:IS200/IS605 family transposase [Candidatus Brachybacter algidus]MBK8747183.1 IS200/IS605 family transposase [Candidatus Brachybacter algidus]MBK9397070.1 IS200/IS605 family transposase [Candidatus Brachybacter algidus]HQW71899.1 IS200/IS605 family transposase [Saprospiraceae bacterium]
MGQSLVKNYVHIVFSTKYRTPWIQEEYEDILFCYLGALCNDHDCQPMRVGGYLDHVHILCKLSKNIALAELVSKVKSVSSGWYKKQHDELKGFYWQNGYGAFSVNPTSINSVIKYIENQRIHHQHQDFQNEFRGYMKKYKMDYEERYVWD